MPARIDFIRSQPEYDGRPLEVMYGMSTSRVAEVHVVQESDIAMPNQSAQQLVDILNHFQELGITMSSVPIPQVNSVEEYMDYSQWVMEEAHEIYRVTETDLMGCPMRSGLLRRACR